MAVLIDGRVQSKGRAQKFSGFYDNTTARTVNRQSAGFLNLQDPQDLAKLVALAFVESPQYTVNLTLSLNDYANDGAAGTAGLTTGMLYQTSGTVMIKQ